jgi:hypothetical protein
MPTGPRTLGSTADHGVTEQLHFVVHVTSNETSWLIHLVGWRR